MSLDFLMVADRPKKGYLEIYPKFICRNGGDLMIRGGDFYAVYNENTHLWSTDENALIELVDNELDRFAEERRKTSEMPIRVLHLWDSESGMIDDWHHYCQKQRRDCWRPLDESLVFCNTELKKEDYASKRLPYTLAEGDCPAFNELITTLYEPSEKEKIEWCIGAVVSGDSRAIQKFMVLYGAPGSGKSTILDIIAKLFSGYWVAFQSKSLGSNDQFPLEAFKDNPLVAIDQEGNLNRIEDNTTLNSLVGHDEMVVNIKHKNRYPQRFKTFLFIATNNPVEITDSSSGIIRRLIDVYPSGKKIPRDKYFKLINMVNFELGAIAYRCLDVYRNNPKAYDDYVPQNMMGITNDFYNFMLDYYLEFEQNNSTTLDKAWEMYKIYCENAKVPFRKQLSRMEVKKELKAYFDTYEDRGYLGDKRVRNLYTRFKTEKFGSSASTAQDVEKKESVPSQEGWIEFKEQDSLLDVMLAQQPAQEVVEGSTSLPSKWDKCKTVLKDIDSHKVHHVKMPLNHIVIDFDIPDSSGNKSLALNLAAANEFPKTYAELSKSGEGIHLHYLYAGDPTMLSPIFGDHIEIKVFNGNASLRRKLTKCNDIPVNMITSALPLKEVKTMINYDGIKDDKHLHNIILKHLKKEIKPKTIECMQLIVKCSQEAYNSDMTYDITDLYNAVMIFASRSTNHAEECLKMMQQIKWKSRDKVEIPVAPYTDEPIVFYDVEVFPNLFVVCWSVFDEDKVHGLINPTPEEIEPLFNYRLVGFNNKRYDDYMMYARSLGYTNERLFMLSQRIIQANRFYMSGAENVSYTDIYDFSSKKQSLKQWEIDLHIFHHECEFAWDKPVPPQFWPLIKDYCCDDVRATKAVWNANKADWAGRQILADWAESDVHNSTNNLTGLIVFGDSIRHVEELKWRDMGDMSQASGDIYFNDKGDVDPYTVFDKQGRPIFPGYKFENGHSLYRDEDPKEGGYVYSEPGIYIWVALLDIASMHPSSAIAEEAFGKYTKNFEAIKTLRVFVKHKEFDKARAMLPERMHKYLEDEKLADDLAYALKIAINAVYGLTSARFANQFKSAENVDNLVAKRGALFMINLKHRVQEMGYTVIHIKTDSIKIANADMRVIQFVKEYGEMYKYTFEHEGTYERICLVNKSVYIARFATVEQCAKLYGDEYLNESKDQLKDNKKHGGEWTATGTQFAVPYVFKTMFSGEPIEFYDMCESRSVTSPSAMYLLHDDESREFVGKVGYFAPVKAGTGGGVLQRIGTDKDGNTKYDAVTGTTGYYWRLADEIQEKNLEDTIDRAYYISLVDAAIKSIRDTAEITGFDADLFMSQEYYKI